MKVHVSTFLNASPTTVWSTVKRKELLHYVIAPMGTFSPLDGVTRGPWIPGTTYDGRSFLFSIIPVGTRTILIESVDDRSMTIQSREHGEIGLTKWDHLIAVKPEGDGSRYSDTIEIDAGVFTLLYWWYAEMFYRHRQRKWRKLVKNNFRDLLTADRGPTRE